LRILSAGFDEALFFEGLRASRSSALLLDYDGTLAPFVTDRQRAYPYPGMFEVLTSISRAGGTRVAIVSGRPMVELIRLVGPGFELWASHGIEHRARDGSIASASSPADPARLESAAEWVRERGWEGILERKPFGFSLHARADLAMFRTAAPAFTERWSAPLRDGGFEVRAFDAGLEVRPAGRHKGEVVERVLEESGAPLPVAYLGDDESDEDAFRALRGRGLGILVCPKERPTLADVWLRSPDELLGFLERWAEMRVPPDRE
jgi:trehalose-phosphatase